jgi:FMN phosphatase YigB (HAD superfamily)
VVDLDDTLIETSPTYIRISNKAYKYIKSCIRKQLGSIPFTDVYLRQKHLEIDSGLRTKINPLTKKPYHYSLERFPLSFVKTYRAFCEIYDIEPEILAEQTLFKIGSEILLNINQYIKLIKKEAKKILVFLVNQDDIIILLTKGDIRIQGRKIKALKRKGLSKFFTKIKIVPDKNQKVFKMLKKGFTGKRFFSVGNEYKADIEPAIKAEYFGIYIPASHPIPWERGKLKQIEIERDKVNTNKYRNLLEIKKKYRYL